MKKNFFLSLNFLKSNILTTFIPFVVMLLISNFIIAQSNLKLHQITPKWKLNDQKNVQTKTTMNVFLKDSLLNHTEAMGKYYIKVIDTAKNYTLQYSNETNDINIVSKSSAPEVDSVINVFTDIVKKIEKETNSFKYELIVDKKTGQAIKVRNSDKLLKLVEQVTSNLITEFGKKKNKPKNEIDSIKKVTITYFKKSEPEIIETILNEYNYIMQPYSYEFPYNGSVSQKTMVHDVNALGEFGNVEIPAVLTISSKKTTNNLTIETDTDYDKNFLLKLIKKKYKNMSSLTIADLFLSEKTESIFNNKSSWIETHKSNVVFITKDVKVINETIVSFQ